MTEDDIVELKMELAEAVGVAVRRYIRKGGEVPDRLGGVTVGYVDNNYTLWNLETVEGNTNPPGIYHN